MRKLIAGGVAALVVGLVLAWTHPPARAWIAQKPASGGGGTLALGATCTNNSTSGTSLGCTLTTQGSSGVLVIQALWNPNPAGGPDTNLSVASTNLGSWGAKRVDSASSGDIIIEWTMPFTTTDTSDTITVTTSAGIAFATICAWEIKGAATSSYFDAGGPVGNAGPDPVNITTSTANDFIFAGFRNQQGTPTPGTGWTTICAGNFEISEYQIVSSTGTYSATLSGLSVGQSNGVVVDAIHN